MRRECASDGRPGDLHIPIQACPALLGQPTEEVVERGHNRIAGRRGSGGADKLPQVAADQFREELVQIRLRIEYLDRSRGRELQDVAAAIDKMLQIPKRFEGGRINLQPALQSAFAAVECSGIELPATDQLRRPLIAFGQARRDETRFGAKEQDAHVHRFQPRCIRAKKHREALGEAASGPAAAAVRRRTAIFG